MHYEAMKHIILLALLLVAAHPLSAEIFKWVDEEGEVHFSDKKPLSQEAENIEVKINSYIGVSYNHSIYDTGKNVVMYSTSWCGYCKKARKYFKKKNIKFIEYDVEKNSKGKRDYKKLGAKGVPVILVGKKRMDGFSGQGFERIYK